MRAGGHPAQSWNDDPLEMVADSVAGLLDSPGHRETMLSPEYRKVNIGLAWDRNVFKVVQHFEGDYVELDVLPVIEDGMLELEGNLTPENAFTGWVPLMVLIVYDPAPRQLSTPGNWRGHTATDMERSSGRSYRPPVSSGTSSSSLAPLRKRSASIPMTISEETPPSRSPKRRASGCSRNPGRGPSGRGKPN